MRLATRFRLGVALSVATALALGALVAWAATETAAADAERALAVELQSHAFERAIVRDEFLLFGEPRAQAQWDHMSEEIARELGRAAEEFEGDAERRTIDDLRKSYAASRKLFAEVVGLRGREDQAGAAALRDRIVGNLLVVSYELSSGAERLAEAASRRAEAVRRRTLVLLLVFLALALAAGVANAALTSRLLQRRVARLQEGTRRVASGELAHRIAMSGDDELAELGHAFDGMAESLERQVAQLGAANAELEAFSYSVSHDLRAPLRHVTGFVGLVQERAPAALDEKSRHYLQVISDAARKMGTLIDDLLAFSRTGRAGLRPGRVALAPLVAEVVGELSRDLDGRAVEWDVAPLPEVAGDAALLRQVWANLVSNALKFSRTRAPAHVEIGAVRANGELHCYVKDDGVGFDPRYADKLFGVFQRLHREDEFEGNGVGLATVQRIVHRHGGRVWAESAPEQGATFWFSLPVKEGES